MSRREFSKKVKNAAFDRAAGRCEGILEGDEGRCPCILTRGKFHYDHDLADWMGGEPTLENCVVLCIPCHHTKTAGSDVPAIAKAKRIIDRERGIRKPSRLKGQSFRPSAKQHSASRPVSKSFRSSVEAGS
jgi:5-methylcytosine-specific restriction protein A